jgi:thiosulfate dehydrogenase [quinone] large subunit
MVIPGELRMPTLSSFQRISLVVLRMMIGWHFLYEGFYKLMLPGWSRAGQPLAAWSAAGYLKAATGPLAPMLHAMAQSPRMMGAVDIIVPIGLLLVGLSLIAGLFTQAGCAGAAALLLIFYLSNIPTTGLPQTGAEGAYLLVNKNLIELAAVLVIASFHTGEIAGFDVLRKRRRIVATVSQKVA